MRTEAYIHITIRFSLYAPAGLTLATSGFCVWICSNTYSTTSRMVYSSGPVKKKHQMSQDVNTVSVSAKQISTNATVSEEPQR